MAAESYKLIVLCQKCVVDATTVKQNAKLFFEEYHNEKNIECVVSISEQKNVDFDNIYNAELYEIEINLFYSQCTSGIEFCKIGKEWCNPQKNKLSDLWLRLANRSALQNKSKLKKDKPKDKHSDVDVKEIGFGTLPNMQHFMCHYVYGSKASELEILSTFWHTQRYFYVYMCIKHNKSCRFKRCTYKFKVDYKSISRVIINDVPGKEFVELFFHLYHIPYIYCEKVGNDMSEMQSGAEASFLACDQEYQEKSWERALEFGCRCNNSRSSVTAIGKYLLFKVVISRKHRAYGIIERLIQRCLPSTLFYFCNVKTSKSKKKLKDFELFPHSEKLNSIVDKNNVNDIKFSCQYAWEVIFSRSMELRDQIILKYEKDDMIDHWEFLKEDLKKYSTKNVDALCNALYHISEMVLRYNIFTFEDALHKLFVYYHRSKYKIDTPEGICLVRRIIITPSRIICLPPSEHFDNRVVRKYGAEFMLRVSVQDDDFSKLTFAVQYHSNQKKFLKAVAWDLLLRGIDFGPRCYEVLASSNSQLRDHGIWMYAKDHEGNDAESIRKWMGDFSHIRSVAKYMARMGQCFSSSEEAVQLELEDDNIIPLNEIMTKDGKFKFSDGVGMISKDLAEEVRNALKKRVPLTISDSEPIYEPSAFQIRFKGCKGMVAESKTLIGRKLGIRPSMEKFLCLNSNLLEIVKVSAPRPLFLNRPLISILEQLGVKQSVFLKLQKEMVIDITESLIYEKKACKMLANLTSLDFPYKKLLASGICITEEPFFRSLLLCVYKTAIDKLRTKARICIPPEYGRNMLGVIDETGTLEYGQVFVQYSEEVGYNVSPTKILEGIVLVTKNPCMHPGDVRKLKAVNVPALKHIKDCIVFPAKGERPHPDEMAGSDLDGDEFVVIWLDDLIFPQDNFPPMDYPANAEIINSGSITVDDMIKFFFDYIKNDNVGQLANAHLVWSDWHPKGIFSNVCMKIAKKYPLALDFAKSGCTAYLSREERPKNYPDFMEKGSTNNNYKSKKALGILYRVIRNLDAAISRIDIFNQRVTLDPCLIYAGWEDYKDSSESHMREYSKRIKSILKKYGLQSEAEALSGFVGRISDCFENRYEKSNIVALSKSYIMDTIKRYRYIFSSSCENECRHQHKLRSELQELKYRRASAWYMVAYTNQEISMLSFPWIVSDILCEVRNKNIKNNNLPKYHPKSSFIASSNQFLLNSFSGVKDHLDDRCFCVIIMYNILREWMVKSSLILTMSTEDVFCFECFQRIIKNFMITTKIVCCSMKSSCKCSETCEPMKLILEFMKFYVTEVTANIGECEAMLPSGKMCEGFREVNLQSVALQTFASLSVTRKIGHLGFMDNSAPTDDDVNYEEGDPVRIPVTEDFENIITDHMDELSEFLKMRSGVKDVFIDGDSDRNGNWYLLIHSTGKAWQRWNLEEIIMDPKNTSVIKSMCAISSS